MELEQPLDNRLMNGEYRAERSDLSSIREYMAQHYSEPLSIEQLAGMAGLRPKYFGDLFSRTYGQSAMDYLTGLRISKAKHYLHHSDYLLREIAQKVGYSDEFYFSRKFKKETGVPPSVFVKQRKRQVAACSASGVGQLLALDIMPVAAPLDSKWTPYYYNMYYDRIHTHLRVDLLDQESECDKLIKSRPDAIVGDIALSPDWQERLLRNAQTLFIPQIQDSWRAQLQEIAAFLGRERQCQLWLEQFGKTFLAAREQVAAAVGADTCLVLRMCGDELHAYCNKGIRDVLFTDLALNPAYTIPDALYNEPVSLADLKALNPHRLLLIICPDSATRARWLSLQHNESWRSLQAVKNGHMYLLPSDPWFEYSAVAADRMLGEAVLMFTGKSPKEEQDQVHGYRQSFAL